MHLKTGPGGHTSDLHVCSAHVRAGRDFLARQHSNLAHVSSGTRQHHPEVILGIRLHSHSPFDQEFRCSSSKSGFGMAGLFTHRLTSRFTITVDLQFTTGPVEGSTVQFYPS
jgi:hypothetical protein